MTEDAALKLLLEQFGYTRVVDRDGTEYVLRSDGSTAFKVRTAGVTKKKES